MEYITNKKVSFLAQGVLRRRQQSNKVFNTNHVQKTKQERNNY